MKYLTRGLIFIILFALAVFLFCNLSQPVLASHIDHYQTEDLPYALDSYNFSAPIVVIVEDHGCDNSTCQLAQSSASTDIPNLQKAPDTQPILFKPEEESSKLPDYLNQFMQDWSPERSGGCKEVWNFPPTQTSNERWLLSPSIPEGLNTSISYYILAGMLIRNKVVVASECPSGGLIDLKGENLAANNCGVGVAFPKVAGWQNRYDNRILEVAQTTQIPAILLKNFIRQESQFWPGAFHSNGEVGLGQITAAGADTLLRWSPDIFKDLCANSYSNSTCNRGYSQLSIGQRNTLQGAILQAINADCQSCKEGINQQQANFSIGVFAEALVANCKQVDQVIKDITRVETANMVSTYSDLWKITLFNYNAGSGCTQNSIKRAWISNPESLLSWDRIQNNTDVNCLGGVKYVDGITK